TDTAPSDISTLSLHDALPIFEERKRALNGRRLNHNPRRIESGALLERKRHSLITAKIRCTLDTTRRGNRRSRRAGRRLFHRRGVDRKSTRLNSSNVKISYAVF